MPPCSPPKYGFGISGIMYSRFTLLGLLAAFSETVCGPDAALIRCPSTRGVFICSQCGHPSHTSGFNSLNLAQRYGPFISLNFLSINSLSYSSCRLDIVTAASSPSLQNFVIDNPALHSGSSTAFWFTAMFRNCSHPLPLIVFFMIRPKENSLFSFKASCNASGPRSSAGSLGANPPNLSINTDNSVGDTRSLPRRSTGSGGSFL